MKNKDILFLESELPKISPPDMDRWFNYAVQETIQRAQAKAISIKDVVKAKGEMKKYEEALKELQIKHAKKDEFGEPIKEVMPIGGGQQFERYDIEDIKNPNGAFNVAVDKLSEKYKEAIENHLEGMKFLDEENTDFEPYWVTIDQIPNGLTRVEMSAVFLMVKKEEPKA